MATHTTGRRRRHQAAVAVAATIAPLLAACASDGPTTTATVPGPRVVTTPAAPTTPTVAPPAPTTQPTSTAPAPPASSASSSVPTVSVPPSELAVADVLDGFTKPVDLAVRPGDSAMYIVEQGGVIYRATESDRRVVLDISDLTSGTGEQGLLGLAFSPVDQAVDQAEGQWGYIDYTDNDGNTVIAALPVAADGTFDRAAQVVILQVDQPYSNHNGGDVEFGPDGMLYIGMGDGGSGGDPQRNASNLDSLLGKLLRIDPTPTETEPYRIPPDNPFASGGGAPEIWSWGLRNPWRFNFDAADASLWIADVGQSDREEVDHVLDEGGGAGRGVNFGWSAMEGDRRFNDDVSADGAAAPVVVYDHDIGCSISGGAVYRGEQLVGVSGDYFYGDYCAGTLWVFRPADGTNRTVATGLGSIVAVSTGPDDEIYVLTNDGRVRRLVAAG